MPDSHTAANTALWDIKRQSDVAHHRLDLLDYDTALEAVVLIQAAATVAAYQLTLLKIEQDKKAGGGDE